jgi:hypothetical protein
MCSLSKLSQLDNSPYNAQDKFLKTNFGFLFLFFFRIKRKYMEESNVEFFMSLLH